MYCFFWLLVNLSGPWGACRTNSATIVHSAIFRRIKPAHTNPVGTSLDQFEVYFSRLDAGWPEAGAGPGRCVGQPFFLPPFLLEFPFFSVHFFCLPLNEPLNLIIPGAVKD
jgi:hypothetical protein